MKHTAPWNITQHAPSVFELRFTQPQGDVLVVSDLHWDNAHCDRAALKRDLDEAVKRNAPILMIGDTFCLMQGKWDRRKDDSQMRPEHRGGNYFDRIVTTAADWFAPYARNIALITYGNHETSIIQHHETDILQRFDQALRDKCPQYRGHVGAYAGFLKIAVPRKEGPRTQDRKACSKTLAWHHGYGGGGEVTRGLIDNSRTRGQAFADIYVSGHIHRRNLDENVITMLDQKNMNILQLTQWFLRAGTYKREDGSHKGEMSGWHVEKGHTCRPMGGWWLPFRTSRTTRRGRQIYIVTVQPTPTRA
jgi:UDP-2,3-diacylglucosamine pyrophosphatase LpxH